MDERITVLTTPTAKEASRLKLCARLAALDVVSPVATRPSRRRRAGSDPPASPRPPPAIGSYSVVSSPRLLIPDPASTDSLQNNNTNAQVQISATFVLPRADFRFRALHHGTYRLGAVPLHPPPTIRSLVNAVVGPSRGSVMTPAVDVWVWTKDGGRVGGVVQTDGELRQVLEKGDLREVASVEIM